MTARTLLTSLLFCFATSSMAANPATEVKPPNIVIIFADDWGWGDLSCHGHPWLKTPHLDRLAAEGTDFQQFNVLNPVCSPSRAALMTGHYPARYAIHQHFAAPQSNAARNMPDWLDAKAPTLPRFLKQAGYRTAHFGKWHLTNRHTHGAPKPDAYGYDEWSVFNGGAEWPSSDGHACGRDAASFVRANAGKPFFINAWLHESHLPHVPTAASMEKWKHLDPQQQVYAAVITDGDNAVGLILDALKDAGLADNTLVMFSSDNGPEHTADKPGSKEDADAGTKGYNGYYSVGSTGGLRGRKRSLFEGGVRVPFIVRWPTQTPAGIKNDTTAFTAVDLLPTLCAAAAVALPESYRGDGENLLAALQGESVKRTRPIFWEWRGGGGADHDWPNLSVRDGDWKLAMTHDESRVELYHLADDRAESKDIAKNHPDTVARLVKKAKEWKSTLPANPNADCISTADRSQVASPKSKRTKP
ncbi:MAG TPA: N-acetylgalactosamine 6-sulfate sulfatase (GALNS) [Verrucomicrobiales bacterium]|nr:N-acetylgalactosamine 6-sulfate sulfatase (GALNS) [Verrucomicrobiales bacterium]HRJ07232.1 sulfatase-like hydrolase/transferase [Prosthecobacter sp.]HRK14801.1 sulfatase-like hydrolase/transferase [Prosthecobacter sp.]